jgi:hypothetical protein
VLRSAWRDAQAGSGRVVLVHGPEGIGKTRLAAELATEVHAAGASGVYVGGVDAGAAAALERAWRTDGPALLLLDDLDRAPSGIVTGAGELAARAGERPLVVVMAKTLERPARASTRLLPAAGIVRDVSSTGPQALLEAAADRVALAAILDASGRHREAAETLRGALSVYEGVLGADHYEVAGVVQNLAGVAERAGEAEQAAALRARARRIRRRVLGHTHRRSP